MNYLEYLKDNPKGYWFKRKLYGWGWVPVKIEGWFVLVVFLLVVILNGLYLTSFGEPSHAEFAIFFGILFVSIIILILICYKTGEKPRWSWGK